MPLRGVRPYTIQASIGRVDCTCEAPQVCKAVELLQRSMRQLLDIKAHREQILSQRTLEGPVPRIKCLLPLYEDAKLVMRRRGGRKHNTRPHYPCYGGARRKEARGEARSMQVVLDKTGSGRSTREEKEGEKSRREEERGRGERTIASVSHREHETGFRRGACAGYS